MDLQNIAFPEYTPECPEGVHEIITEVTGEQVDENGVLRLGDLARQMQLLVEAHLDCYSGTSLETLQAAALGWIIAWNEITVIRLPKAGEQMRMRVWAGKKRSVMHTRKCAFYTMDGEPLMTAAALFILMDQTTRKMTEDRPGMEQVQIVKVPGEPKPPKMIMEFPEEFSNQKERTVLADEIDKYGHMNNSHYLDWAVELMAEMGLKDKKLRSIWIEYTKEMREGQKAELAYAVLEDTFYLRGISQGEQTFRLKAVI